MGSRRFLVAFGLGGGAAAGLVIGLIQFGMTGQPNNLTGWSFLLVSSIAVFWVLGYLTWFQWATRRARSRAQLISQLAQGDLAVNVTSTKGDRAELARLAQSLRRALAQVQRVSGNVHRTSREVGDQARSLLEAARRQSTAVDRSLDSVTGMGDSLVSAGKRVGQLEVFSKETTASLGEMTERIEQVALALTRLNAFAGHTSQSVLEMSERLSTIAASGDALVHFANEAEDFVAAVDGGIDAVRRRASETGDLAREVTATAERGQAMVLDSVKGMYRIEESVSRAAERVESLGNRSAEIGRVVDVIQEVADQTHLLALNAAIIAAQAGESGHAFAVVADEVGGLAERTARSTREIVSMVKGVQTDVQTTVALVTEGRAQAASGVALGERAARALDEILGLTQRTFSAVESTVAETARLEAQGDHLVEASRRVARRVDEVTQAAVNQAAYGRELVTQTQEMARVADAASRQAGGQARTGRDLTDSVLRLAAAIDEIRSAHQVLTKGDVNISHEVAQVRDDATKVTRIADGLSRTVEQLRMEADGLEAEVYRFKLPAPRRGGSLRVGIHQSVMLEATRGLDPLFTLDLQLGEISSNLYSSLLRSEDGIILPDLAERWEVDADACRYLFHLRRDVHFHDGTRFRSSDVKAHFERLFDPQLKAPVHSVLEAVEGVAAFVAGESDEVTGFQVVDEHALEIRLQQPKAFFLHLLALPLAQIARIDSVGRPLGTGPFKLASLDSQRIVLERNPTYYRADLPLLDKLEFCLYQDRAEALARLGDGEVDLVSGLYAEHLEAVQGEGPQLVSGNTPSCWFLGFNVREPDFADVRIRQALRAGLDIEGMVERFHPGARVARGLTPPGLMASVEEIPLPHCDLALARRLMAAAGVSKIKVSLYHPPGRGTLEEDRVLFAPLIEAGLVELTHVELGAAEYFHRHREGRIPSFRSGWIADYPDPDNFLHFLGHSSAQSVYSLGYRNEEFDRLTAEARISSDPERRNQLYRRAELVLHQDCVLIPLYNDRSFAAASPIVQGLRLHQTPPQVRFEGLWVDRDAAT